MNSKFNRPKGFGEILDHTFSLSKNKFADFFLILLIIMGPVYLLEALINLASGVSFFRETGVGSGWLEQISSSFTDPELVETNLGADLGLILMSIISFVMAPIAQAAVLIMINKIRNNEEYTVGSVIKRGFSKFWPILGTKILYGLITFGLVFVPLMVVGMIGAIGAIANPFAGILLAIILFLGVMVGVGFLLTRWSFYFGSVVIDNDAPGLSRSWKLTRGRTWLLFGLYIIFYLIIGCINLAIELTFGIALGNSVLLMILVNVGTLFTTMIFNVGFAVMYFDLKVRHDADDLKDMIDDYNK
ncbi:hypothetical protein [Fredinandcohnia quinoae]|uniref:DUF7847 domain-containing protein n=1 Tax=Fredinandcohnia quinoae TaxID=2918902 RepID=A0AAW5E251_9BACI|nr:hypothetical protein [Fredinandcohnia sp. SECRCQ15]MCH1626693.1 hypothetical protein [Fredinandcohnia sp. SECRCQ15]